MSIIEYIVILLTLHKVLADVIQLLDKMTKILNDIMK